MINSNFINYFSSATNCNAGFSVSFVNEKSDTIMLFESGLHFILNFYLLRSLYKKSQYTPNLTSGLGQIQVKRT